MTLQDLQCHAIFAIMFRGGSVENMRYDLDMISDIIMKETGKGAIKNGNVYRQQNRLSVMSK